MIDFSWLDSDFTLRLCLTLLHSLWQFILLALMACLVGVLIKRRGVQWLYSINVIALVIGLAMLPVTFALLSGHQAADNVPTTAFTQTGSNQVGLAPPTEQMEQTPLKQHAESSSAQIDQSPITAQTDSFVATAASWRRSLATWATALYVIGVVLMLLRLVRAIIRANRLAVQGSVLTDGPAFQMSQRLVDQWSMKVTPTLRLAEDVVAPKVVGVLRSTILLPASALSGLSHDQLEMILAHELAHVRRHDMWVNLFQRIAEAILFFNPALWFLSRRISALREYCCDELACEAVSHLAGETRTRYAETLLRMVELNLDPTQRAKCHDAIASLAASGSSQSELRRRVARLFGDPVCEPLRMTRSGAFTLAGTLFLLFAASTIWNTGLSQANSEMGRGVTINGTYHPPGSAIFRDRSGALFANNACVYPAETRKPAVALEGPFADQFEGILKDVLEESALPLFTEKRVEEICDQFSKLIQLDSIDLEEVSEERRIAILTSLRDTHAPLLCLEDHKSRNAFYVNRLYLKLPDLVKTLQWKVWMALSRGELNTDQQARQEKQRDWMREIILSLPDDKFARRQRELCELDEFFDDPLLPQFDRAMSDKQFIQFQQMVREMLEPVGDRLTFIAFRCSTMAFESCWDRDNVAKVPLFDEDKIQFLVDQWRLVFASNERHRGRSGALFDFFNGDEFCVHDIRTGHNAETLWEIRKNRDPDAVLRSLEEREVGHVILDAKKSELVGIRGAKLLRLDTDLLHAADAISDQELRRLVETQGTERVDLSDCFAKYMEFDKGISRDRPAGAIFGILSAEGDLAVWWTEYFSKYTSGELKMVHFHARRRIAQLEP